MGFSSFYAGLSGLKAHSASLNVIGNNLANVNTIGYKGSRISFAEMFSSSGLAGFNGGFGLNGGGSPYQVGMGVQMAAVQQLFSQGSLQPTEVVTDLGIQGGGFFVLRNNADVPVYGRAGNFSFDAEGYLVSPEGFRVQGYTQKDVDGHILPSGTLADIQIPSSLIASPEVTSYFRVDMNLNAGARVDDTTTTANEAEVHTVGITLYDSLGDPHDLTIVCTPQDTDADGTLDQWAWEARIPKADLGIAVDPGDPEYSVIGNGTMTFDENGQLTSPEDNIQLDITGWANGASDQTVEWRVLGTDGNPAIHGFSAPSATDSLAQNGYSLGRLRTLAVDNSGLISGVFTNGETLELAQVAMATFNNPQGLLKSDGNTFMASIGSGPAALGAANTGGRGSIISKTLEQSNVDITDQFTDLIVAERGYQSNSRVITTTDTLMQEALTLKR